MPLLLCAPPSVNTVLGIFRKCLRLLGLSAQTRSNELPNDKILDKQSSKCYSPAWILPHPPKL
jgi:hypothetical protein